MSETRESVRETLERAFEAAEANAPPPPRPVARETREPREPPARPNGEARHETRGNGADTAPETREQPTAEPEAPEPSQESRQSSVDRPRDQFGRYMSATPEGPKERPVESRAEPEPTEHEIPDQPEAEASEQAEGPAILAPQSWSAAERDHWRSLPRPVQEILIRREREASVAIQQRAEQVNTLEPIANAIRPYAQKLALRGIPPASAVEQLLAVQDLLDSDPVRGVAHVANMYRVDLRQFATAFQQAQQPTDPAVQQLMQEVAQQRQMLQGWQQAAQAESQGRVNTEVEAFAADARSHPYFEHVRQTMAGLMRHGNAASLEQAYQMACAADPQIVAAMAEDAKRAEARERNGQDRQAAERARRAAVSVTGAPGSGGGARAAPVKRSIRDALSAAYDEQVAR